MVQGLHICFYFFFTWYELNLTYFWPYVNRPVLAITLDTNLKKINKCKNILAKFILFTCCAIICNIFKHLPIFIALYIAYLIAPLINASFWFFFLASDNILRETTHAKHFTQIFFYYCLFFQSFFFSSGKRHKFALTNQTINENNILCFETLITLRTMSIKQFALWNILSLTHICVLVLGVQIVQHTVTV